MTYPALAIELPLEQRILLGECLADLTAVQLFRGVTDGLLTVRAARAPLEVTQELAAAMSRLGEENAARWKRLKDAGPFIMSLGERLTDGHIEAALTAFGHQDSPELVTFRQRAQQEGGPATFVRSRLDMIPTEFAGELDRAIGLYRYFASWPDGFRPDAPAEFEDRGSLLGCAAGITSVAVGGIAIGVAATAEVLSAGLSTPASAGLFFGGIALVGGGAALAATQC